MAAQDAAYRGGRDLLPELAQLTLHAAIAPARVLAGQTQDQLLALAGQWRTTWLAARATAEGSPLATDQLPMPANDGLRAGQEGRPGRSRELAAERCQEQAITAPPAWPAGLAPEDAKLMAEEEDLGPETGLGAAPHVEKLEEQAKETVEEGQEHDRHHPRPGRSPRSAADRSFRTPPSQGSQRRCAPAWRST